MFHGRRPRVRQAQGSPVKRRRYAAVFEALEKRIVLSTVDWISATSGSWDVGSNWSTGQVPGSADDVVINVSGASPTVTISANVESVNSIRADDPLAISGGGLTVAAGSTISSGLSMTGGSLSANGSGITLTVTGATAISEASLYAQGGATVRLPQMTSYASDNSSNTFQADGANSVLDLSALTNIDVENIHFLANEATDGGTLNLGGLTSLTVTASNRISFTDTGGSTLLDGKLTTLTADEAGGVDVVLDGTDPHVADLWTSFTNGYFNVTGGSYTLPGLTDVDGSSLYISSGGKLTLPGSKSFASNLSVFQVDGAGSVLDVSALTNVTQQGDWWIAATDGGTLNLGGLSSLTSTQGMLIFDTGGSTLLDGALTDVKGVHITLDGTDAQVADAWKSFAGNITLTGGSETLPNVATASF